MISPSPLCRARRPAGFPSAGADRLRWPHRQGYLFTRDSQPLHLSDEAQLRQGHIALEFDPDPMWSANLRLHNERSDFSVSVPSSAYRGRSFFLASRESGLRYDIQARRR